MWHPSKHLDFLSSNCCRHCLVFSQLCFLKFILYSIFSRPYVFILYSQHLHLSKLHLYLLFNRDHLHLCFLFFFSNFFLSPASCFLHPFFLISTSKKFQPCLPMLSTLSSKPSNPLKPYLVTFMFLCSY